MKKRFYFRDAVTNILIVASSAVTLGLFGSVALAADPAYYVKKDSWQETVLASREALMKLEQSSFEGAMDEVRIYNRRLSEAEIVSIKDGERNVRSGLAGWWQFEAGAADSSGSMNHGRAIRTEPTEGKFGKALRFSGSSHVVLPAWPSGCHTS